MEQKQNIYNPCLFTGIIGDPEDPTDSPATFPLTLGLYIYDFVSFSTFDEVEQKIQSALSRIIKVDFMGIVEWLLGIHFQ